MADKRALITGIRGQDAAYLARLLLEEGCAVFGADKKSGDTTYWRLKRMGVFDDVRVVYMDMTDQANIIATLEAVRPDEIYNLAAQSFVENSFRQPLLTTDVNAAGTLRLLEAIRLTHLPARFYQASSSEMYGASREIPQTELTPFYPRSPYGVSKLFAHWITVNYRESYTIHACCGILYNHESPLRNPEFVTRKITRAAARIARGLQDELVMGNIDVRRDWGFAGDYADGIRRIMRHPVPDDYILATGESHSIREFIDEAFAAAGIDIDWEGTGASARGVERKTGRAIVRVSDEFFRPADIAIVQGDAAKARTVLGWEPRVAFRELVRLMVESDLREADEDRAQGDGASGASRSHPR
ncbi:MAG TPA: GDP-mannose 4,6-dehydratase [Spirochaetota bacterium]|nr:GDP-mannose 4,6-dehydratase [Spirochaetota bacterium]HNT12390.1 GDP-mannose 4,6-dehydratase [Spirochaetota bacterium]